MVTKEEERIHRSLMAKCLITNVQKLPAKKVELWKRRNPDIVDVAAVETGHHKSVGPIRTSTGYVWR